MDKRISSAISNVTPLIASPIAAIKKPQTGFLDVLNCGTGHLRFGFDSGNASEVEKAKAVIQDMLKRGYMLFIQKGNEHIRVRQFDPETNEYLIEEPDPEVLAAVESTIEEKEPRPRKGNAGKLHRTPMSQSKATAIAPTAGG